MKQFILSLLLLLFTPIVSAAESFNTIGGTTRDVVTKAYDTTWLENATVKYGLLVSLCSAQALTGATEAYHFNGNYGYVNESNYHAYETIKRLSYVSTGYLSYALYQNQSMSMWQKLSVSIGSALIARNCFEWSYKNQRYNNPFDYTAEHNRKAIVYIQFIGWQPVDAYIGTDKVSGPIVDGACLLGGLSLVNYNLTKSCIKFTYKILTPWNWREADERK